MRYPHDHVWSVGMPNDVLWHSIIDTFGFPAWIRHYDLVTGPDPVKLKTEADVRRYMGPNFLCILITPGKTVLDVQVYGYFPVDFARFDIHLAPDQDSSQDSLPGSWTHLTSPPLSLLA